MDVLINLIAVIISQCLCISNHHLVDHFKYITIFFCQLYVSKGGGGGKEGIVVTITLLPFFKILAFN